MTCAGQTAAAPSDAETRLLNAEEQEEDARRWQELWEATLRVFQEEAGDPPEPVEEMEDWELVLLEKCFSRCCAKGSDGTCSQGKRSRLSLERVEGPTLAQAESQLRSIASRLWRLERAAASLRDAASKERLGDLDTAADAYERALDLGLSAADAQAARLRYAQLLRAMGIGGARGGLAACEAQLRQAVGPLPGSSLPAGAAKKAARSRKASGTVSRMVDGQTKQALQRLSMLLCQEGREEEVQPLLRAGGWRYRLSPAVLRYALGHDVAARAAMEAPLAGPTPPCIVLDDALPDAFLRHLREVFKPQGSFWREHGYNEIAGSGENGYFSYLHSLGGEPRVSLDFVIRRLHALALPHFLDLADATAAEWWAHCRPHPVGHQLHFDSDDEGIGGARHPICSVVVFVDAPGGMGGPTLVTDQRLADDSLAAHGWLAHPRTGRVVVFDASVLHGVVPGRGEAPKAAPVGSRRVTWMVAFWRKIATRPFGEDGLAGSSRPLPDTSTSFTAGPRTYTWHQCIDLTASPGLGQVILDGTTLPAPKEVQPLPVPAVWTKVNPAMSDETARADAERLPKYDECFQW